MQNANEFAHDKTCYAYPRLSMFHTDLNPAPVNLNDPFYVDIALKIISNDLSHLPITLVATVCSGYNDYMLLNIPAEHLDDFFLSTAFNDDRLDFAEPVEFIPLENDVYAVYTSFTDFDF
jgi:hypothetical protein